MIVDETPDRRKQDRETDRRVRQWLEATATYYDFLSRAGGETPAIIACKVAARVLREAAARRGMDEEA